MSWSRIGLIARVTTPWIELVGERWRDDRDKDLEYWRVVAAHSVIVVVQQGDSYLLPEPMFRPGVDRETLDFCGGRLKAGQSPADAAREIVERELGLRAGDIAALRPINEAPWLVNSSASDQRLHGFHATLHPGVETAALPPHRRYPATGGARALLADLDCLQCRALLLETLLAPPGP